MEELLQMWRGRECQVVGAATAKLREPKHVRTRGTANKLQPYERSLREGAYCFILHLHRKRFWNTHASTAEWHALLYHI